MFQPKQRKQLVLPWPFCSIQALNGLDDAHTLTRMMFTQFTDLNASLFWRSLTDTSRCNVLPAVWASHGPVKFIHKINHHRLITLCQLVTHMDLLKPNLTLSKDNNKVLIDMIELS